MPKSKEEIKQIIINGDTYVGIELGSTRIKTVMIDDSFTPIASGNCRWESEYCDPYWTYTLDQIWDGLKESYADLIKTIKKTYGVDVKKIKTIGVSAMMHGFLAFDQHNQLVTPYRTWRNATTQEASTALSNMFDFNIPQRWSIAHLYQAIINEEPYIKDITYLTTLAGYVHWQLTGQKVIGIGDSSGMFPVSTESQNYDENLMKLFNDIAKVKKMPWSLEDILPIIIPVGTAAGQLISSGAKLLDPSGNLEPGISFCAPEGDAATGMVATNSVQSKTGNVSAGTSIFAMIVLENQLKNFHPEIDLIMTPTGKQVAMIHSNSCSSDLDAWINLFITFADKMKFSYERDDIYDMLFNIALEADEDSGDLLAYNFYSGEQMVGTNLGRPLFVRKPESNFTLANFMRTHLYTALCILKKGMDILFEQEIASVHHLKAHGGLFKVKGVVQKILADAMNVPIAVSETAGEGGAWGMAILAAYVSEKHRMLFETFLEEKVFVMHNHQIIHPTQQGIKAFEIYYQRFMKALSVEKEAIRRLK